MSIFTALTTAYSLEDAFKAKDCTSQAMRNAIDEWFRLYYDRVPTKDSDPCQRIAYTVVNKLTKTCFGEYNATSEDEFAQSVLVALDKRKRKGMQILLAGGESWIKPIPTASGFSFNIVRRDNALIFGRDATGVPNDIGTTERTAHGKNYYTLLERRFLDATGRLTIQNKLYCSETSAHLGRPVPLQTLPQYADLPDEYTFS